ncbi:MAG TPA: Ig-like domain repeat protein [Thermoanaerobaculia bacterium]|nr:Ig-like domain repeat protein [Thermoanaerobaculia bacterium]
MKLRRIILTLLVACFGASLFAQDVTVDIQAPLPNSLNGDTLNIQAAVTSVWDIASVKGNVEGREVSLSLIGSVWKGSLSLAGLAHGSHVLTVTAEDVNSATATDQVTFIYDTLPVIELTEPLEASGARPLIRVVASCEDDDPVTPCKIVVRATAVEEESETLAVGFESIDEYVSLENFDGKQVNLIVTGTDSAGQAALAPGKVPPAAPGIIRVIYADASSRLEHVLDVPGVSVALGSSPDDDDVIFDIDADRILYVNADRVPTIRDRDTSIDTVISLPSPVYRPQYGYLTPRGAILVIRHMSSGADAILEWQDSAPILHGNTISQDSLRAAGQYAIWMGPSLSPKQLLFRDIVAGTTTVVDVGETPGHSLHDVDDDGTVAVWTADYDIYLWDAGVATPLVTATASTQYLYPVIDGTTVVYRKQTCCTAPQLFSIIRNDSGVETELAPPSTLAPLPRTDYQVNNGWVAFTKPGASGERKVYTAEAGEAAQQMSFVPTHSFIETFAPDGTVAFTTLEGRYFGSTAPPPDRINSELGKTHLIDGVWHVALGRTLFLIGEAGTPTTITLVSSGSPTMPGDSVTFTATVSESTATGLVVFKDPASGVLGSATLSGGVAAITTTMTVPGDRSIVAVYGGDDDFAWSESAPIIQVVNATSTTTLTSTPNPSVSGSAATFTATVTIDESSSPPGGSVQFRDGATVIASRTLSNGRATLSTATLSVGTHSITAVYLGTAHIDGSTSNVVMQQVLPIATPTSLTATATSASTVAITWSAVTNAHHYDLARSVNNGPFAVIASPTTTSYPDTTVSANLTYLYQVRAVRSNGQSSPYSGSDPATTVMFNRDPLVPGVHVVKAVDILELRTAVNAMRASAGLPPIVPSPPLVVGGPILAVHIEGLRAPLNEARTAIGVPAISYTDPTITASVTKIKAAHVQQLRNGCK